MNINRNNCESFFLDYYEKTLSPVEVAEVLFFLEENPALKEVFESYRAVFLEHEKINFPDKARRTLDLASGAVTLEDGDSSDALAFDGDRLVTTHGPRWRMLLIGAGQLTHYVAQLALSCDYHVLVCDPRGEYAEAWDVPEPNCSRRCRTTRYSRSGPTAIRPSSR